MDKVAPAWQRGSFRHLWCWHALLRSQSGMNDKDLDVAVLSWEPCGSWRGCIEMLSRRWLPSRPRGSQLQRPAALQLPGRLSLMTILT